MKYPDPIRALWKSDTMRLLRTALSRSARIKFRMTGDLARIALIDEKHADYRYRNPVDLRRSDVPIRRALVLGSCMAQAYADYRGFAPYFECDFVLAGGAGDLPADPPQPIGHYDFQFVSLPFRTIVPDHVFFAIRDAGAGAESSESYFRACCDRLDMQIDTMLRWNRDHKLLSFVANFLVPQQNSLGKVMPRYDLRNPVYFVEKLNEHLHRRLSARVHVHMIDIDAIAANFGRKKIQDDHVWHLSHGSYLGDWDDEIDGGRIEPTAPVSHYYDLEVSTFFKAVWEEIGAVYRILHPVDAVKLVAIDLDDTIWRGVMMEQELRHAEPLEGWPLGFVEALVTLKQRGIILAIISKNDDSKIEAAWEDIFGSLLRLSDFAIRKINWQPKTDNMAAVLKEANILPRNAVFIDDNPLERAAMQAAYPEIRILGDHPYLLRRILLWAPETQVPLISDESSRRTDMVQQQLVREATRSSMSRDAFLAGLKVRVAPVQIGNIDHPKFARAMELVNKTNQFNTTGERWALDSFATLFHRRGCLIGFTVADQFSNYGMVAVAILDGSDIRQFVMSCRVIGLDVEYAALAYLVKTIRVSNKGSLTAQMVETKDNILTRPLYPQCGFIADNGQWRLDGPGLAMPQHIRMDRTARSSR